MITHRYTFLRPADWQSVEASLLLSIWAVEALHGEDQYLLDARYRTDERRLTIDVDATTQVGVDLNRILLGYFRKEFPHGEMEVCHVNEPVSLSSGKGN